MKYIFYICIVVKKLNFDFFKMFFISIFFTVNLKV